MDTKQIHWVAGLVEGEGYFGFSRNTPILKVGMTDKDVLDRLADIWGTKTYGPRLYKNYKPMYGVGLCSKRAASWMMTLYSLMGERRKERIKSVLKKWRDTPKPGRPKSLTCQRGHEFTLENTGRQHGKRFCRVCQRKRDNRWHKEHREYLNEKRRTNRNSKVGSPDPAVEF